jgi:hypothetical protein
MLQCCDAKAELEYLESDLKRDWQRAETQECIADMRAEMLPRAEM